MKKEIKRAFLMLAVFSILTGLLYPVCITAFSRSLFSRRSAGSFIVFRGKTVGSELIGQNFTKPEYFHGRPSEVNNGAGISGGSNLGPTNRVLMKRVQARADNFRLENGLSENQKVPADMVSESASGLDPHISLEAALFQVRRVSAARNLPEDKIFALVGKCTENPGLGFFGQKRVNVLKLNVCLDEIQSDKKQ